MQRIVQRVSTPIDRNGNCCGLILVYRIENTTRTWGLLIGYYKERYLYDAIIEVDRDYPNIIYLSFRLDVTLRQYKEIIARHICLNKP